jgi:hypothetical protein
MLLAKLERITLLAEEASEVVQICMKIIRHGPDSYNPDDPAQIPNRILLGRELGDMEYAIRLMVKAKEIDPQDVADGRVLAESRKPQYLHYQE